MYYYNDGENEVGPFSLERLKALRQRGLIGSGTLVRGADDRSWTPFASVAAADAAEDAATTDEGPAGVHPPLRASHPLDGDAGQLRAPRATSPAMAQEAPIPATYPSGWLAQPPTPWRRYAARILDTSLNGIIGFSLFGIIFYSVAPASADRFLSIFDSQGGVILDIVLSGLIASLIGGSLIGVSGFTLGKLIFGVRVSRLDGARLGLKAGVVRDLSVFVKGLGLCIPIVAFFTALFSYRTLTKEGATTWDAGEYVVLHRPSGAAQYILNVVGIVLIFLVGALARALAAI